MAGVSFMPSAAPDRDNGSCRGGATRWTASSTVSYCCGPVTASTFGIARGDLFRFGAHAAGDDHLAVLGERRADGGKRFRLRAVEEAAGIDDREIGVRMSPGELITFGAQPRDDALGIDQRFRAAERNEGDTWGAVHGVLEFALALGETGRSVNRRCLAEIHESSGAAASSGDRPASGAPSVR